MRVSIKDRFWIWKELTWRPFINKLTCRFKGHDWVNCVSIAGGYTRTRWCKRCPERQVQKGWIDRK